MEISDVRIRKIENDNTKFRAIASVTIDDCFVIHDIKIIEGRDGLFIAMPSKKTTDGTFRDIAHPLNSETRQELMDVILNEYNSLE